MYLFSRSLDCLGSWVAFQCPGSHGLLLPLQDMGSALVLLSLKFSSFIQS